MADLLPQWEIVTSANSPDFHIDFLNQLSHTWSQEVYPSGFGIQGGGHAGRIAKQSQGTLTHSHTHSHIVDKLDMPFSLSCMSWGWGWKPSI